MANSSSKQIIEEGPRNAIVKLAGVLDTSDMILAPAISLADFLNNDVRVTLVGLRVDTVDYSSGPRLVTTLEWNSNTPQLIMAFAQSDELEMKESGGAIPDMNLSGYDGSINLRTRGYSAGDVEAFTVFLKLVKLYRV